MSRPLLFKPSNLRPLDLLRYLIFGMEDDNGVTLLDVVGWISSAAMVGGSVLPYIPQYLQIKKTSNADGFSLYVCLTLLVANILRILFWFGTHYEIPLLFQSIIMNLLMLALIQLCVRIKQEKQIIRAKDKLFTADDSGSGPKFWDFDHRFFWKWTDFRSYVEFVAAFTLAASVLTYALIDSVVYVEVLGFTALLTEALLGAPQFYDNYVSKSTYGMSKAMVLMWLVGDTFKTFYFVYRRSPMQFCVCGALQIAVDLAILSQTVLYGSAPGRRKTSNVLK